MQLIKLNANSSNSENLKLHSNCIIGPNLFKNLKKGPTILNNITICANLMVIDPVTVKNNYTVKPFEIYS